MKRLHLKRISIQWILSRAQQSAIDMQSGHAYFAQFGSTIRARDRTKIRSSSYIANVVTDPAGKVSPEDVSIRLFALVPIILLISSSPSQE